MAISIVDEIYNEIVKRNALTDESAIPYSDEFIRSLSLSFSMSVDNVQEILLFLIDSHKILSFEVVSADSYRDLDKIMAYLQADIDVIRRLKFYFQEEFVELYNTEFHKNLMIHQVIKEFMPQVKNFNNTKIGRVANIAIMLEQEENLIEKNYAEYTEQWKYDKLVSLLEGTEYTVAPFGAEDSGSEELTERRTGPEVKDVPNHKRVSDAAVYEDFVSRSKSYPLSRVLKIYGIEFFLRANLRNYKFKYLIQLLNDEQICRKADLIILKELITKMRYNIMSDPQLMKHKDEFYELERLVLHKFYFGNHSSKK